MNDLGCHSVGTLVREQLRATCWHSPDAAPYVLRERDLTEWLAPSSESPCLPGGLVCGGTAMSTVAKPVRTWWSSNVSVSVTRWRGRLDKTGLKGTFDRREVIRDMPSADLPRESSAGIDAGPEPQRGECAQRPGRAGHPAG
jgi:hypothetical protein